MAKNDDPDNVQKDVVKGKRSTRVIIDFPRDNSSLEISGVHGKDLPDRGISHSISGSVAPEK